MLVRWRALDAIDDEHVHRTAARLELQAELFLQRTDKRRGIGRNRGRAAGIGAGPWRGTECRLVRCELESEFVRSCETGTVDHDTAYALRGRRGEL